MRQRSSKDLPKRTPASEHDSSSQTDKSVHRLQRQLGNRTVRKLLLRGTEIAGPDDAREREARATTNDASAAPKSTRAPSEESHPLESGGAALDPALRLLLERRVGHDLRGVRIHNDASAGDAAEALNAKAFTTGSDIVFGRGHDDLSSPESMRLLTHEAAHATQAGTEPIIFRETAKEVVDNYSELGGDYAIALHLRDLALRGEYAFVVEVINEVGYFSRDDVSLALLKALTIRQLIRIARSPDGQVMLRKARNEVTSGWEREEESDKAKLIDAVLGDALERRIWNGKRIEAIKETSPSDLESLARLFEDDEIVDDGSVQSRLEAILSATAHLVIPGLQTGISFSDTGFRGDRSPTGAGFRDPHPSSQNQPGHFLTAVGLRFTPELVSRRIPLHGSSIRLLVRAPATMSDEEVALRLTIGHEKAPDPPGGFDVAMEILFSGINEEFAEGPEGETDEQRAERVSEVMANETDRQIRIIIAAFRRQFEATTDADIAAWNETLARIGPDPAANTAAIEGPDSPLNRIAVDPRFKGTSRQDLRLSLMGWRLGQMIRGGEFADKAAVAAWIRANLGPQ